MDLYMWSSLVHDSPKCLCVVVPIRSSAVSCVVGGGK